MNRGSRGGRLRIFHGLECFNEAPIHESGKWSSLRRSRSRSLRFNEAPIHESGKYNSEIESDLISVGFNEAPIHESGKSQGVRASFENVSLLQ